MRKLRIYLAGPITNNFWRDAICPNTIICDRESYFNNETEINEAIITGPHSINCDHGCYHSKEWNEHAARGENDCMGLGITRKEVTSTCLNQIDKSDAVFAYVDSVDAYGTILEIGYAIGKGKLVVVLFSNPEIKENLWFVASSVDRGFIVSDLFGFEKSIKEAFNATLKILSTK